MALLKNNAELTKAYQELKLNVSLLERLIVKKDLVLIELHARIVAQLARAITEYEKEVKDKSN